MSVLADNPDESGTSKNNPMKISLQSENTMTSAEEDEVDLEEVIWNLMGKSGILADIKVQILNFIQNYDQLNSSFNGMQSENADGNILTAICEYLQWIGMKYTYATILSESPVKLNNLNDSERKKENYKPLLYRMFEKSKDKEDIDEKIFSSTPNIRNNNVSEEDILNGTGDEINSSGIDVGVGNKTFITSAENPTLGASRGQPDRSDIGAAKESIEKILLNDKTFEIAGLEVSKEIGDSFISGGDVINSVDSKEKQDFSEIGKSNSDTFEEESLLELVEDLSLDKDKKVAQVVPSVPSLITFESVNSFENVKHTSDSKDSIEKEEDKIEDENPVISKEIEDKSDSSAQINEGSKSKLNETTTGKSESHHFEEESISELLEDLSLDNTEDDTIPPESKDIKDCDYVLKLSQS